MLLADDQVPWNARRSCSTHYVHRLRTRRMSVDGRRVIAEAARVSDNFLGLGARPTAVSHVDLGGGRWARVSGTAGDDAGLRELLAIARTVRPGSNGDAPPPASDGMSPLP